MANPVIPKEKIKEIEDYLLKGHSQNKTARKFGVSDGFVNKLSRKLEAGVNGDVNIHVVHSPPKKQPPHKAIAARKAYAKKDRLKVLNKLMGRVDMAIDSPDLKINQLCFLTTALGTLLDKYRLEEKNTDDSSKGDLIDHFNRMKEADAPAT